LQARLKPSDLRCVPMIARCYCDRSYFFAKRASPKREPAAIAESEDWAMALAGVGVAVVPEGVARGAVDVAVRPLDVDVKREVGLAYSGRRPPSDALQGFIAGLKKQRPGKRWAKTTKRSLGA